MLLSELFPELISEKYSQENGALARYLDQKEFDPYAHWYEICHYLCDYHMDVLINILDPDDKEEDIDPDELAENTDADLFYKLPKNIQEKCTEYILDDLMRSDPANAPSWHHMSLNKYPSKTQIQGKGMVPASTWLVHFTDNPYDIASDGFKYGVDQMDKLGLTRWLGKSHKQYPGYNFAFIADSRDAIRHNTGRDRGKYGKYAVLFQNSGVNVEHYGDEENQIIFHGSDVNPKNIIVLTEDDGDWCVNSRRDTRRGDDVLFKGSYIDCVHWVRNNFAQYRKLLFGK